MTPSSSSTITKQVCIEPRLSAVNVSLPAFAAERRAAASLLLSAGACYLLTSPAGAALRANSPHATAAVDR